MNAKQLVVVAALSAVGISACASTSTGGGAGDQAAYEQAVAEAKAAKKKAASVGGEWRDIGKILKKADALAKKGEYGKAIKLANKAREQGELGYIQANEQRNAGPHF